MISRTQNWLMRALSSQMNSRAIRIHRNAAVGSSVGLVRNQNEDCCLIARTPQVSGAREGFTVAVVCDGLGGMAHGREAAILGASSFVAELFCSAAGGWEKRLSNAIFYANSQIYQQLRGSGGTTLSAVVSYRDGSVFCHVGDSRIYGIMPDRVLEQLSRDDTINAVLKRQADGGDAPKDSRLLQFVGVGAEMEPQIGIVPNRFRSVLITSDGAHDIPHSVLQRVVSAAMGGSDLIRKLLALSDMTGGRDNASAVLLPVGTEAEFLDDRGENELLAILPNDTATIQFMTLAARGQSEGEIELPPDNLPLDSLDRAKELTGSEDASNQKKAAKRLSPKAKKRATKPSKSKVRLKIPGADTDGRLPLDEPANEVDVQFSAPAKEPDEEKQ